MGGKDAGPVGLYERGAAGARRVRGRVEYRRRPPQCSATALTCSGVKKNVYGSGTNVLWRGAENRDRVGRPARRSARRAARRVRESAHGGIFAATAAMGFVRESRFLPW